MPGSEFVVLIALDGVVHTSDLPVQSFARHLTEHLSAEEVRPVIAGMRGFLEGKAELIPDGVDLAAAQDGYQAVEILARAAGLTDPEISWARRSSRIDLANSAWAIDPADGLDELLDELAGRFAVVRIDPGDPAGPAVLGAIDLQADLKIVESETATAVADLLSESDAPDDPQRLLVIGTRWSGELEVADAAGCPTAMIDRFDRGLGHPRWRARDLTGLLGPIRSWRNREQGESADRSQV